MPVTLTLERMVSGGMHGCDNSNGEITTVRERVRDRVEATVEALLRSSGDLREREGTARLLVGVHTQHDIYSYHTV